MDFCPHLCATEKTFRSVTHPEIAPIQSRLTPEFFMVEILEKKVHLGGMSILQSYYSLEPGCHNLPPLEDRHPPSVNPKPGICPLDYVHTSSIGIHVPYIQLAAYVPPPRGPMCHAYIHTSLTCTLLYHSQLNCTCL
jgi:hypothetical protein